METNEIPYDVFNWEEDTTTIFGYGVPRIINNSQRVVNSAWRMMMKNASLSVAPQIVVNEQLIEPALVDGKAGNWNVESGKVWTLKDKDRNVNECFGAFHINSNQQELAQIFQMAKELGDAETNLPMIAQGEANGPMGAINTASGMNLLMNSANISLKKAVKAFDDNVTRKHIKRYYDWNMQNNEKEEIKGDYAIDARGSSSLMLKETQAQNMTNLINIAQLPAFAPLTDMKELYKMAINSMQIEAENVIIEEEPQQEGQPDPEQQAAMQAQQQAEQQAQAQQEAAMQAEQMKQQQLQADLQVKQAEIQMQYAKMEVEKDMAMMRLAAERDLKIEDIRAKFQMHTDKNQTQRDMAAVKAKTTAQDLQLKQQNLNNNFDTY